VAGAALAAGTLGLLNGAVPVVASAMVGESADRARRPLAYGTLFVWRDLGVVVATLWGQVLMQGAGDFGLTFRSFAAVFLVCGLVSLLLQRYAAERF
jgi:MFS family permease